MAAADSGTLDPSATTQVSLDPPPWLELTTRPPSGSADARQTTGKDPHRFAVVHREWAQVDVPRDQLASKPGWHRRQADHRLGDPGPWLGGHVGAQPVQLRGADAGAEDEALAARSVHPLEDVMPWITQHLRPRAGVGEADGRHVRQYRILVEVIPDQVRDVAVDELVVRDPVAYRVRDGNAARAGGVYQAGAADK